MKENLNDCLFKYYLLKLPNCTFKKTPHQKTDVHIELVHIIFSVHE